VIYQTKVYRTASAIVQDEVTGEPWGATAQELEALEEVYAPHLEN
jgi:hypothetical protein